MLDRWKKLHKDLYNRKTDFFDLSKVPDVHDNIRYDLLHNWHLGLRGMDELHALAKHFADTVVPQEYGVDKEEKRILGSHMCQALLEKIKYDLIIARGDECFDVRYNLDLAHADDLPINSLGRRVRTRLYFTSESHLHSLLNVMRFPPDEDEGGREDGREDGREGLAMDRRAW
uniref:diphosphoinositol-pentakisphosphate 1-kinase n=1 Tax=Nannochloropsis gaditana (strain CCMP526) TaxID=1093141 RepID=I2CR97_NANGC